MLVKHIDSQYLYFSCLRCQKKSQPTDSFFLWHVTVNTPIFLFGLMVPWNVAFGSLNAKQEIMPTSGWNKFYLYEIVSFGAIYFMNINMTNKIIEPIWFKRVGKSYMQGFDEYC